MVTADILVQQALLLTKPEPAGEHANVHWTVTRPLSSLFTGREDSLKSIEDAVLSNLQAEDMSKPRRYVITGMGGQGKSELCLKVVNKLRRR